MQPSKTGNLIGVATDLLVATMRGARHKQLSIDDFRVRPLTLRSRASTERAVQRILLIKG